MTAHRRVLIVDDEREMTEVISLMLSAAGYRTEQVQTGTECLESVDSDPPDLLVLDIMLPDIDGWEVITRLKQAGRDIPILITSASEHAGQKLMAFELASNQDYITKPFDRGDFLSKVDAMLGTTSPA